MSKKLNFDYYYGDESKLPTGAYVVTELECPGYVIDDAQRIIQLDANETAQFVFTNSKLPSLQLIKVSSDGTPLAGVSFRLAKIEDASHYLDRTTDRNGEILWEGLEPGVYSLIETATVNDHILDLREHHVELFPGKTSTIVLENDRRPNLTSLYDNCTFEAKKMISAQFIKAVRVRRDYELDIEFNVSFEEFQNLYLEGETEESKKPGTEMFLAFA